VKLLVSEPHAVDLREGHDERLREHPDDAVRHERGVVARGEVREHDDELVAAEARDGVHGGISAVGAAHAVGAAEARLEAGGDLLEDDVARAVAERVVHPLEAVEVDREHGAGTIPAAGLLHHVRQHLLQERAIRQAGELVVERHVRDFLLHGPAFALGAQEVANAMAQDAEVDGLRDEVGRACAVGELDRFRVVEARGDEDEDVGARRAAPDLGACLVAVHARHHDVEHHEVRLLLAEDLECFGAAARLEHFEAVVHEAGAGQGALGLVVVDDQDLGSVLRHVPRPTPYPRSKGRRAPAGAPRGARRAGSPDRRGCRFAPGARAHRKARRACRPPRQHCSI
jgi:hypothetical protein